MLGREFVEARVNTEPLLRSEAGQRLIASAFQRVTHGVLPRHRLRRSLYCIGAAAAPPQAEPLLHWRR